MNSLGLSKKVNWLYLDTNEGLIYFEIYDIIQPGIVDWSKVKKWVFDMSYNILHVCLIGSLPEGKKVGILSFRNFASGLGLVTPPSRKLIWEQEQIPRPVQS